MILSLVFVASGAEPTPAAAEPSPAGTLVRRVTGNCSYARRLLGQGLARMLEDRFDRDMQAWLASSVRGETTPAAGVRARTATCAVLSSEPLMAARSAALIEARDACGVESMGLLSAADALKARSPSGMVLGSVVYRDLLREGVPAEEAETLGRWVAGLDQVLPMTTLGDVGEHWPEAGVPVVASGSSAMSCGCVPVVPFDAALLEPANFASACESGPPREVLVLADGAVPMEQLVQASRALAARHILLTLGLTVDANPTAASKLVTTRLVDRPPAAPAPVSVASEPAQPSAPATSPSRSKTKAGVKPRTDEERASIEANSKLLDALIRGSDPIPRRVVLGGEAWTVHDGQTTVVSVTAGDLDALLRTGFMADRGTRYDVTLELPGMITWAAAAPIVVGIQETKSVRELRVDLSL